MSRKVPANQLCLMGRAGIEPAAPRIKSGRKPLACSCGCWESRVVEPNHLACAWAPSDLLVDLLLTRVSSDEATRMKAWREREENRWSFVVAVRCLARRDRGTTVCSRPRPEVLRG